jgi:hypothetical protein
MRQRRWVELIKDYELEVHYHPGKANMVADALSRNGHYNYLPAVWSTGGESSTRVLPDLSLFNIKRMIQEGDPKVSCFRENAKGTLWFKDRLIVLRKEAHKKKILDEAHTSRYSIHPGSTKMYHDLRQQF